MHEEVAAKVMVDCSVARLMLAGYQAIHGY